MSEEYQDGIPIVPIDYGPADGEGIMSTDYRDEEGHVVPEARYIDKLTEATELLLEKVEAIEVKLVNLANKLDEHLKERDAHNAAMMHKK